MSILKKLFGGSKQAEETPPRLFDAPRSPDQTLAVIGDIHGEIDLLEKLLDQITETTSDAQIVCVGDVVDRGQNSRAVLELLQSVPDIICLRGNHEEMMLDFLDNPVERGARWLRNGGLQTLQSFAVGGVLEGASSADLTAARDAMREAMGTTLETWVRELPVSYQSGNVAVVHAGANPAIPIDAQEKRHLFWGHRDFARIPRNDGIWVVHGHTIIDHVEPFQGRIDVDTGAYATGRLSAAILSPNGEITTLTSQR